MSAVLRALRALLRDRLLRAAVLAVVAWAGARWTWAPSPATVDALWSALLGALGASGVVALDAAYARRRRQLRQPL